MEKERFLSLCDYFIRLVRFGLGADECAPNKPTDVEWADVYELSERHSLTALCFFALKGEEVSNEVKVKWERAYDSCVRTDVLQLYAWEEIKQTAKESGLKLLPLKGLHVKKLYPQTVLRQMGDLDILYEAEKFPLLKEKLQELGYAYRKESTHSNHQVFFREPVTETEFHSDLMPEGAAYRAYYEEPWKRAVKTEEENIYAFSRNDEYVYSVLHAAKHYGTAGSGIRTIADFYLYLKKYKAELDRAYIDRELKKADELAIAARHDAISAVSFEKMLLQTVKELFEEDEIIFSEESLRMISDGVYGSLESFWKKGCEKTGKKKYIFKRLFPSYSVMKRQHPVLKYLPFLLPFFWFTRMCKALFKNGKRVRAELKYVSDMETKNAKKKK